MRKSQYLMCEFYFLSWCILETSPKTHESVVQFEDFTIVCAHFQWENQKYARQIGQRSGKREFWYFTIHECMHFGYGVR